MAGEDTENLIERLRVAAELAQVVYPETDDRNTDLEYARMQDANRRAFQTHATPANILTLASILRSQRQEIEGLREELGLAADRAEDIEKFADTEPARKLAALITSCARAALNTSQG